MSEGINVLITKYEARIDVLREEIDEINELLEDDFNPMDASGGNFDDAYYMGDEHGATFAEYRVLVETVRDLKSLKEGR